MKDRVVRREATVLRVTKHWQHFREVFRVLLVNTAKVKVSPLRVETAWRVTIVWVLQCDLIQLMTQRELGVQKEHTVRLVPQHPRSVPLEHTQTSSVPQAPPFAYLAPLV